MDRKQAFKFLLPLIVLCSFCFVWVGYKASVWLVERWIDKIDEDSRQLSREKIESFLQVKLPKDAKEITYDGYWGSDYIDIHLEFSASPESVLAFAHHFCEGILYEGYNPFQAPQYDETTSGKVFLFKRYGYTFYSAPNASQNYFGNTCFDTILDYSGNVRGNPQYILLDKTDLIQYRVTFEESNFGGVPPQENYVTPADDLPFMIIGLKEQDQQLKLVTDEICFDMHSKYYSSDYTAYRYLSGARVQIFVDQELVVAGRVGRYLGFAHDDVNDIPFHCYTRNWTQGKHTIEVYVGVYRKLPQRWAWDFYVDD